MSAAAQAQSYTRPNPQVSPPAGRPTGPRTPEGKARAAGNALRHGLYSNQAVIRGEDPFEFAAFRGQMLASLAPADILEQNEAETMLMSHWKLQRLWRQQTGIYAIREEAQGGEDPDGVYGYLIDSAKEQAFTRLKREEAHLRRQYQVAAQRLDQLRDQRFKRLRPFVPMPLVLEVAEEQPIAYAAPVPTPSAAEAIAETPERTPAPQPMAAPPAPAAAAVAYAEIAPDANDSAQSEFGDLPERTPAPRTQPEAAAA